MQNKQASCQQGFTLIEAMIVIAIVAVLLSIAVPSFNDFFQKNRLKRAAEEVYGMVVKAKGETVIRDVNLTVSTTTGDAWCVGYAVTSVAPDCCSAGVCAVPVGENPPGTPTAVSQQIDGSTFAGVTMTSVNETATFDSVRGAAGNTTIKLDAGDWDLNVVVSTKGRVRICAPDSSKSTMGYIACPP